MGIFVATLLGMHKFNTSGYAMWPLALFGKLWFMV